MAFFGMDNLKTSPAAKALLDSHIPSRIAQQDASVYDFSPQAMECASSRLGWTNLATKPPTDPAEIMVMAQQARCQGLDAVVLIGQGGSTQAPQTITKLHSLEAPGEEVTVACRVFAYKKHLRAVGCTFGNQSVLL